MSDLSNSVFISFRRRSSGFHALYLWQQLTNRGLDVFYDAQSIKGAGDVEELILPEIERRPYLILLLAEGTLDGCADPTDWVRREINHALSLPQPRVVVPVYTEYFEFNDLNRFLSDDTADRLRTARRLRISDEYAANVVDELVDEYLLPIKLDVVGASPDVATKVGVEQEALSQLPPVSPAMLSAEDFFARGVGHHGRDELDAAIADYDTAIWLNPEFAAAFHNRGTANVQRGDLPAGVEDLKRALELHETLEHLGASMHDDLLFRLEEVPDGFVASAPGAGVNKIIADRFATAADSNDWLDHRIDTDAEGATAVLMGTSVDGYEIRITRPLRPRAHLTCTVDWPTSRRPSSRRFPWVRPGARLPEVLIRLHPIWVDAAINHRRTQLRLEPKPGPDDPDPFADGADVVDPAQLARDLVEVARIIAPAQPTDAATERRVKGALRRHSRG